MSIRDRLKTAYENVALHGDTTWTESTNIFQEANKKLYSREQQIKSIRIEEERPRTVKDSIPNSKLATYNDYEYNESRELCYTRCIQKTRIEFLSKKISRDDQEEPWLLPDVDTLFVWFICCQNQKRTDCGAFECCQDHGTRKHKTMEEKEIRVVSPLLNANGFQEKKLKMTIISDKVKIIWNTQQDDLRQRCIAFSRDIDLTLSKLPSLKFYNAPYDPRGQGPILDEVSKSKNEFEHLKDLPTSFKQQNGWMSKSKLIIEDTDTEPSEPKIEEPCMDDIKAEEPVCPKRLYSAVLQGLTTTEMERKEVNHPMKTVPKPVNLGSSSMLFPKFPMCRTSPVVPALADSGSTTSQLNQEKQDSTVKTEEKIQNKTSVQANVKILPKVKSTEATPSVKTQNVSREVQQNSEDIRNPNNFSFPLFAQSSYGNNYSYQFNASHYSNSYHNSCGCTNAFTHTSHVITNRNMQSFQRQSLFVPSQYQYAHPFLMLQQNRTSIYPISQPIQTPYYYQPLHQTRIMQRWIVPQNYTRANVSQVNFLNTHFVPQTSSLLLGPNQQQQPLPSTSQYFMDSRLKAKVKKAPQPQINTSKCKLRNAQAESSISTESADSEHIRKIANSISSCLDATPSMNKPSQLNVKSDIEEVVSKTVNILFEEELPITSTVSEELEIQALEQYCSSNDNVYQELERQAAEQYDELSGNLRGPPTYDLLFGGLSRFIAYSIDVNV